MSPRPSPEQPMDESSTSTATEQEEETEQPLKGGGEEEKQQKPPIQGETMKTTASHDDAARFENGMQLPGLYEGDTSKIDRVTKLFRRGAAIAVIMWLALMCLAFRYAPPGSMQEPTTGLERSMHILAFVLLIVTNGSRFLPMIFRDHNFDSMKNGVMMATLAVQLIAIISNIIMAFLPTPVMIDPIVGIRVHLVRWAEWTPLAFLMSFLTTNLNTALGDESWRLRDSYAVPILMALSTVCGGIFPFCTSLQSWMLVMVISWTCFMSIYWLLYQRRQAYLTFKDASDQTLSPPSPEQREQFALVRSSYYLCIVSSGTWTLLAITFCIVCALSNYAPPDSIWAHSAAPEVSSCIFEIMSKILYLSALVDAYDNIFDQNLRAIRRLEELRSFMVAVWESSSDVIVFCGKRTDGRISARVSPAFLKLLGVPKQKPAAASPSDISLLLEIDPAAGEFFVFAMDLFKPVTRADACRFQESVRTRKHTLDDVDSGATIEEKGLIKIAKMSVRACREKTAGNKDISVMQELSTLDKEGNESTLLCEAKISQMGGQCTVFVLRDISDRFQRFETEKKLVREMTARKKDAEANKFTRHEVKNGVLAAIGLLDHVRESVPLAINHSGGGGGASRKAEAPLDRRNGLSDNSSSSLRSSFSRVASFSRIEGHMSQSERQHVIDASLRELDGTLRDILDTILDEAMAREIVYGEYEPRRERVNVPAAFELLRRGTEERFPLHVTPVNFPELALDRQLLRYIYRNAVSNACKYGKLGGTVATTVSYNSETRTLGMVMTNQPGEGHGALLNMEDEEAAEVFAPGKRFARSAAITQTQLTRNESSGNGAWIMQKCAFALGGECSIQFKKTETSFVFSCPVKAYLNNSDSLSDDELQFTIPENTWGVALDDSAIQRKLMDRFLGMAGIVESKRCILGATTQEVFDFGNTVVNLMKENPNDYFLVIADENLDMDDGVACHHTVSGSQSVQDLRLRLDDETEKRLLALIRSANDSTKDVETYMSRAHGYLLKEPIRKGSILKVIEPWWTARFANGSLTTNRHSASSISSSQPHKMQQEAFSPAPEDIGHVVKVIDALTASTNEGVLESRWPAIREKLLALKGDLKTMKSQGSLSHILEDLDSLIECSLLPMGFLTRWGNLEGQIELAMAERLAWENTVAPL